MSRNGQPSSLVISEAERAIQSTPVGARPGAYTSIAGPLYGGAEAQPVGQARETGAITKEITQNAARARNSIGTFSGSASYSSANNAALTPLEKEAGLTVLNGRNAGTLSLNTFRAAGVTVLIVAGLIAIALGSVLIATSVQAWKQSKQIKEADKLGYGEPEGMGWAKGIAIVAAVLGGLGVISSLITMFTTGSISGSVISFLFASALLVVGIVTSVRLFSSSESARQSRSSWSLWAAGLVFALGVLFILAGLAPLVLGIIIASI